MDVIKNVKLKNLRINNKYDKFGHLADLISFPASRKKKNFNAVNPDSTSIKMFFDMRCEICKTELSTLQHAKHHYLDQHDIPDGYIKCCEMKFRELKNINDHLQYHMNPNIFKYVVDLCVCVT